jgi:hypothetical protein
MYASLLFKLNIKQIKNMYRAHNIRVSTRHLEHYCSTQWSNNYMYTINLLYFLFK